MTSAGGEDQAPQRPDPHVLLAGEVDADLADSEMVVIVKQDVAEELE